MKIRCAAFTSNGLILGKAKPGLLTLRESFPLFFYYWVKKFQRQQSGPSFSSGLTGFRQLSLDQNPVKAVHQPLARVCYPSGVCIELYQMPDAALLKSLA
jgi:hypothetical protein